MKKISLFILSLVFVAALFSSGFCQAENPGKKAVMLIAHQGFQDDEFVVPKKILEQNGINVTVASTDLGMAAGMNGMKVKPDILVNNLETGDFDAVVFVGGSGAMQHINDKAFHKVAIDAVFSNKIVGAICIAPAILAKAGVLEGKNMTVHPSGVDYLKGCTASYTGRPVEIDGRIITASGPEAAKAFGMALVRALSD